MCIQQRYSSIREASISCQKEWLLQRKKEQPETQVQNREARPRRTKQKRLIRSDFTECLSLVPNSRVFQCHDFLCFNTDTWLEELIHLSARYYLSFFGGAVR